jgi:hypothetical protein
VAINHRDDGALVVAEPRSPLEGNVRSCTCYSIDSRRNQREMSACNIKRCYIVNWTGAFNKSILLVSPVDAFDAGKFAIQTRIIGRIAVTILIITRNKMIYA